MSGGFVDTGGWIALMVERDSSHHAARRFFQDAAAGDRLATSNLVLSETYTWLTYHDYHRAAVALYRVVERSIADGVLAIRWVDRGVHDRAWEIFERYDDQAFSFCDCTSFVITREERVDYVFGFDRDFLTMGLVLRP